jgi:hypothetical protein
VLKRIVIDLCVVFAFIALVVGSILVYSWIKERPEKAKRRVEAEAWFADLTAQKSALLALGNVDFNPSELTLSVLKQKLNMPVRTQAEKQPGLTKVGWACGKENCAIWAEFLIQFGQEIPPSTVPGSLTVFGPPLADYRNISAGGIHLGESEENLITVSRDRGFKSPKSFHTVSWDKDWDIGWAGNGKLLAFVFLNHSLLDGLALQRKAAAQTVAK